jgi:small-conductance mechanosensitive channel
MPQNLRDLLEEIRAIVEEEAAKNIDGTLTDNPAPSVLLKRFDNYAAVYELRAYTNKPNEYLKIQSEIRNGQIEFRIIVLTTKPFWPICEYNKLQLLGYL